jgi:hypothetical protein
LLPHHFFGLGQACRDGTHDMVVLEWHEDC